MEHLGDKVDFWRLAWIILGELEGQLKRSTIPGSVIRAENHSIPGHDIIIQRCTTDAKRGILLHSLEVSHQPPS